MPKNRKWKKDEEIHSFNVYIGKFKKDSFEYHKIFFTLQNRLCKKKKMPFSFQSHPL
jgi:hypothetical protein